MLTGDLGGRGGEEWGGKERERSGEERRGRGTGRGGEGEERGGEERKRSGGWRREVCDLTQLRNLRAFAAAAVQSAKPKGQCTQGCTWGHMGSQGQECNKPILMT